MTLTDAQLLELDDLLRRFAHDRPDLAVPIGRVRDGIPGRVYVEWLGELVKRLDLRGET